MVRLGTPVRVAGREGIIIARTLSGEPYYDVRLADGSILHYIREADLGLPPERRRDGDLPLIN